MRIALAAALVLLAATAFAQTSPMEAWTRAQQGPPAPIRTHVDSLVIAEDMRVAFVCVGSITNWMPGNTYCPHEPTAFTDSLLWSCEWQRYVGLPALDRTAEEYFLAKPENAPTSAIALRDHQPRRYDRIDYRLVVTAKKLPPAKRNGPERTLVTASAQFIGFPHAEDGIAFTEPVELESSGLIERDFFERLRARLANR